jgi:hypothetical protein
MDKEGILLLYKGKCDILFWNYVILLVYLILGTQKTYSLKIEFLHEIEVSMASIFQVIFPLNTCWIWQKIFKFWTSLDLYILRVGKC